MTGPTQWWTYPDSDSAEDLDPESRTLRLSTATDARRPTQNDKEPAR